MNLVREKVIHKKYGTGEITKLDNDHVYVKVPKCRSRKNILNTHHVLMLMDILTLEKSRY